MNRLWGEAGRGRSLVLPMLIFSALLSVSCLDSSASPPPDESAVQKPALTSGATTSAPNPVAFTQVAVGENHSCALQKDGRVLCWSGNNAGQLSVPDGARFRHITAGYQFSCGIRTDGRISCWGRNTRKQADAPDGQFTAVDAGWDHACALGSDGATCWGWEVDGRATPPPGVVFTEIGAGAEHSCGLTSGGDLRCWGKNDNGRADSRSGPFLALAVGIAHTCVLRSDGTAFCQGENAAGQSDPPDTVFTQITAGSEHTCGILPTGPLECWGGIADKISKVSNRQLAAPPGNFSSISAGWESTCAINAQGHAQCWGYTHQVTPVPSYDRLNFENVLPAYSLHPLDQPTEVFPWPAGGLAIVDKAGSIMAYTAGLQPSHILDLTDQTDSDGPEDGLLSAAVDPEFSEFPFLYVYYTTRGESEEDAASTRLTRFPVVDGRAVREEELIILDVPRTKPDDYHHGGAIRFGPDGMLYLGIGDSHCFECPQSLESLHGKIIRIDVRGASAEHPYKAPDDNPLIGMPDARPEIWAYGLRNPWRMAFDSQDGKLWVGDVGMSSEEEVTIATAGANLGWPVFEGFDCFSTDKIVQGDEYDVVTEYQCSEFEGVTAPAVSYGRTQGCAVVGGVVYRGAEIPWLDGVYLFSDFCTGKIWALDKGAQAGWRMIEVADLTWPVSSFGTDAAGNVYVLTFAGPILRLVEAEAGYAASPVSIVPSVTIMPPAARSE